MVSCLFQLGFTLNIARNFLEWPIELLLKKKSNSIPHSFSHTCITVLWSYSLTLQVSSFWHFLQVACQSKSPPLSLVIPGLPLIYYVRLSHQTPFLKTHVVLQGFNIHPQLVLPSLVLYGILTRMSITPVPWLSPVSSVITLPSSDTS